jgi:hypothetical protein
MCNILGENMWQKIKNFILQYLNFDDTAVEETIVIISVIFLISMIILLSFVFLFHQDMPSNITNFMEAIWTSTVGAYVAKGIYKIYKLKNTNKS